MEPISEKAQKLLESRIIDATRLRDVIKECVASINDLVEEVTALQDNVEYLEKKCSSLEQRADSSCTHENTMGDSCQDCGQFICF